MGRWALVNIYENIDEHFWTLVSTLRTFNVFCSHITWKIYCFFLLTINFRFDVFPSDNTLYTEIFQCNLYLTSYGWTNTQSYFVLLHKFLHRFEYFPSNMTYLKYVGTVIDLIFNATFYNVWNFLFTFSLLWNFLKEFRLNSTTLMIHNERLDYQMSPKFSIFLIWRHELPSGEYSKTF